MKFRELDPDLCRKAVEGYTDTLSDAANKLEVFYRHHRCPHCRGELKKEYSTTHAFSDPSSIVPRALLRCTGCRYLKDPFSSIVVEAGNHDSALDRNQ